MFEEILFGIGGWIVAALVLFIHLRRVRLSQARVDGIKRHIVNLIRAIEQQKAPLNRLVALSPQGSESRDEAVSALRIAGSAAEEVLRVEPELKPDDLKSSHTTEASGDS